jgi:prephenate dehydratase
MDLEADSDQPSVQLALAELKTFTETLKVFGSYTLLNLD